MEDVNLKLASLKYENRLLQAKYYSLRHDINCFLHEYNDLVGDLSGQLDALLGTNRATDEHENGFYYIEEELKSLRRKMAKIMHPDVCQDKAKAAKYMQLINDAFAKSDLFALIKLETQVFNHKSLVEKRHETNELTDANYDLKQKIDALEHSPEYTLKTRLDYLNSLKNMAIAEVRANLRAKIVGAKQAKLNQKLKKMEELLGRAIYA